MKILKKSIFKYTIPCEAFGVGCGSSCHGGGYSCGNGCH